MLNAARVSTEAAAAFTSLSARPRLSRISWTSVFVSGRGQLVFGEGIFLVELGEEDEEEGVQRGRGWSVASPRALVLQQIADSDNPTASQQALWSSEKT
jgi:hypothetical protein